MAQFSRPDGDVSAGSWTNELGLGVNLFASLDETSAADTDFIQSANGPVNDTSEISLTNVVDPTSSTGHILRYRIVKSSTNGQQIDLTVSLRQGTTQIASWSEVNISGTISTIARTLTAAEADAITNYNDLQVRFVANKVGGGAARRAKVTWAELEVPSSSSTPQTISTVGDISTQEAVSQPVVAGPLSPTAIATAEAFGNASVATGAALIAPNAIASDEALGSAFVVQEQQIRGSYGGDQYGTIGYGGSPRNPIGLSLSAQAIASAEALGSPTVQAGAVTLAPTGISSGEALGSPVIIQTIAATGIATAEALGSPTLTVGTSFITAGNLASAEAFGSATVSAGSIPITGAGGIATAEGIGNPVLFTGNTNVAPSAIASGETFGSATLTVGIVTLTPTGIASAEAVGSHSVSAGTFTIAPNGIASAEAIGSAVVSRGAVTITPGGIATGEAHGSTVVQSGTYTVRPDAIAGAESFGSATLSTSGVTITVSGIGSAEAIGDATVSTGALVLAPSSITSAEAHGSATVTVGGVTISADGIASAAAFGATVLLQLRVGVEVTTVSPAIETSGTGVSLEVSST